MLKYFICPNGLRTRIDDCLSSCRDRCLSKPTLVAIARGEREWTGVPSTTQLLGGTRLAYLKLTVDYAIEPESMAYALLGTSHHARLDKVAKTMNVLSEVKLGGDNTGIFDLLCEDETVNGDYYELYDYKTAGSFKIAQALGIVKEKKPDPTGATYQKDSKYGKKGEVKQVDVWTHDPSRVDILDWGLQLNNYCIKIEEQGFPISHMFVQATVRDGDTQLARNRGVFRRIYKIPIPRYRKSAVIEYFDRKRKALLTALETHTLPEPCNAHESWDGIRCARYCEVREACNVGQQKAKEKQEGDE